VQDVLSGNDGYGGYGYNAGKGWDYPTGWGSFNVSTLNTYIQTHGFGR
jgi:pseudomonalisin